MEQLQKANQLQSEINQLNQTVELLRKALDNHAAAAVAPVLYLPTIPNQQQQKTELRPQFLPVKIDDVIDGYIANVNKEVQLKTEQIANLFK